MPFERIQNNIILTSLYGIGRFKQAFQTSAQTSVVYQCPSTPPSGWGASVFDSKNTESEGWESKDSGSRVKYEYKEEARTVNRRDSSSAESGWGADPQLDGKSTQGWSSAASSPRRDNHHVSSSFSNDNGWGGPASSGHSPSKDANHGTGSWGAVPSGHCGKPESYGWGGAPPTDRQSSWSQQNDDSAPVIDTSWDAPYDSGPSVKSEWGTSVSRSSPTRNNLSTSGDWGYTPDPSDGWNSGGNEIRVKAEAPPPIDLTDDPKNPKDPRRKNKSRSATDQQQTQDVKLSPMRSTASYNEAPESAIRLESSPDKKRRYSTYGRQGLDRLDPESPLASPSRPYTMVFPEIRPTVTPFRTRMPGFDFSSVVKVKKERKPL